jgi:quercetin dioxygenase-like cupin family protein
MSMLKRSTSAAAFAFSTLLTTSLHAEDSAVVTTLMTRPLPELPGKEAQMLLVEYLPGAVDPIHRHDAHAFVYVLEGTIVMQIKGDEKVTLRPGQTYYEGPDDIHIVGRNASSTQRAKFLVVFVKNEGAPILTVEKTP